MKRREFIAGLGGAAAWPLAARAQQAAVPVIGFLSAGRESTGARLVEAFQRGLAEVGYVEGRNAEILYRWGEAQYERVPPLAADLVSRRVAVIVAVAGPASVLAAKSATATIPIVFSVGGDPLSLGLAASLNHPGGNITGVSFLTSALTAKRLELLHTATPASSTISYLVNPTLPDFDYGVREAENAARVLGVGLKIVRGRTPQEIEAAFSTLSGAQIGAVLVDADPLFTSQRNQIATLAARHSLPAMYAFHEYVEAGGLMSYGASLYDAYYLVGIYAGRILKGEKPADLPVQQSTRIKFVINLKTAKALGLNLPPDLVAIADEVIE